jgi:hypothetical protein
VSPDRALRLPIFSYMLIVKKPPFSKQTSQGSSWSFGAVDMRILTGISGFSGGCLILFQPRPHDFPLAIASYCVTHQTSGKRTNSNPLVYTGFYTQKLLPRPSSPSGPRALNPINFKLHTRLQGCSQPSSATSDFMATSLPPSCFRFAACFVGVPC